MAAATSRITRSRLFFLFNVVVVISLSRAWICTAMRGFGDGQLQADAAAQRKLLNCVSGSFVDGRRSAGGERGKRLGPLPKRGNSMLDEQNPEPHQGGGRRDARSASS